MMEQEEKYVDYEQLFDDLMELLTSFHLQGVKKDE